MSCRYGAMLMLSQTTLAMLMPTYTLAKYGNLARPLVVPLPLDIPLQALLQAPLEVFALAQNSILVGVRCIRQAHLVTFAHVSLRNSY